MVVDAMVAHSPAAVGREIITGDRIRGQVCFSSQVIFRSNVGKGSAVQEIITAAETQGSCSYDDIKAGILDKLFHIDRKSVVSVTSLSVRVVPGVRHIIKKKHTNKTVTFQITHLQQRLYRLT